jgi:uncharacterized protein
MRHTIFLDTSYLIALIRKKDIRHADAVEATKIYTGPFLTTDLVLVELANSLSLPPYRLTVMSAIEKIRSDKHTKVIPFDARRMTKALDFYKARNDKSWGLIDCFSFLVMIDKRIKRALTFDEHFCQAGFDVPLLEIHQRQ